MSKYVWECAKNRLITFVRKHTKPNGNRSQATPSSDMLQLRANKFVSFKFICRHSEAIVVQDPDTNYYLKTTRGELFHLLISKFVPVHLPTISNCLLGRVRNLLSPVPPLELRIISSLTPVITVSVVHHQHVTHQRIIQVSK